ncbi:hypothetical protein BTO05_03805 [Winogradskyella sp. PC-19]|uniref:hypothetical protein n=1 Tax=unclassified Winogradskyella TaxID=2615021 RepID=UPI000B3C403D|nr:MULTISPECIES: hypothetical protein [unclassified Winogradskyella]ARV08804.1 hypothetical protein BTO05_03805 [Winogradskyella sp. PC-19]RZN75019.1 MAG: hypothetical protein EVB12_07755 [Winogradskyella sp.]
MREEKRKKKWIKTLQFLAAYLVAAWTFLQFIDWILNRYDISPNWVDLLLWIFIGIIPSLVIYFYHQDRINNGILKLREKIIFPLNLISLAVITYFGFGSSDLGATTKEISYTNDEGNLSTQLITKEEFRIGLPIYQFTAKTQDTAYAWLDDGIQELLYQDLSQDKNLSPYLSDTEGTVNRVSESRIFNDYYLEGTFDIKDSIYSITPIIKNAKNGKTVSEKTFDGTDLLYILDDVSVYVRENIGITEDKRDFYIDLNLNEFYSNSLEAIRHNIESNYYRAHELDPEFSISYFENGQRSIRFSNGAEGEKALIDKAYKYSNKLPLQKQLQIRILRYIAYEEWDLAEKLLKLQLEIDPNDNLYNRLLNAVYGETKQIKAYIKYAEDRYSKNKSIDNGNNLLNASLVSGDYDKVISAIKAIEVVQPNNPEIFALKLRPQLLKGDIESAQKTQDRVKIINTNWINFVKPVDTVIEYLKKNKPTKRTLEKFTGKYRSENSEQTHEFFMDDERLIRHVSNQELSAPILAGDDKLMTGGYSYRNTTINEFLTDKNRDYYAIKLHLYNFNRRINYHYWRYDDTIKNAEKALMDGDYEKAEMNYKLAIEEYPNHYFLKQALKHIEYVKNNSKEKIAEQYNSIIGSYNSRLFWVEDDKLYYERNGLSKIHLYPITEDKYISLSRYANQYAFETTEDGRLASAVYSYKHDSQTWEKLTEGDNYFLKDD